MHILTKFSISSFHKRIVNLSILRMVYFLKKECRVVFVSLLNFKKKSRLLNVLKSPVQFKVGRNQLALSRYKSVLFCSLIKINSKLRSKFTNQFVNYLIRKINKNLISSNIFFKIEFVLR